MKSIPEATPTVPSPPHQGKNSPLQTLAGLPEGEAALADVKLLAPLVSQEVPALEQHLGRARGKSREIMEAGRRHCQLRAAISLLHLYGRHTLASQWQHADWLAHGLVLLLQRLGHVNLDSRAVVLERVFDTMQELDRAGMRFSLLPLRMSWQTRGEQP